MRRYILPLLLITLVSAPAFSGSRQRRGGSSASGQPGEFDYYLLSLSWSPDFCVTHPDAPECGGVKKFAFVVHGLWPQYERGYPKNCSGPRFDARQIPPDLRTIMPSDPLIRHEWQSHGTCSGLTERQYFDTLEKGYRNINIPAAYVQPLQNIEVAPSEIKRKFVQANAGFPTAAFSIQCRSNRFLAEVRICMTKDLQARACGSDVRDSCNAPTIIMRPLR